VNEEAMTYCGLSRQKQTKKRGRLVINRNVEEDEGE
jgi:hypothetical protein